MAVTVDETGHREAAGTRVVLRGRPRRSPPRCSVDPAAGLSRRGGREAAGRDRAERAAGGGAGARLAPVPRAVPQLHADHPGCRRGRLALIAEWGTAVLLVALTVLNAVVGLRQQGKAESAMNALKSMVKATARVRRDGTETELDADQLVPGDVVILAAGGQVPADGRIVDGERPADRRVRADRRERAGGQGRLHAAGRRRSTRATRRTWRS